MLNPSSRLKGEKDWQKYEKARKLKGEIEKIRERYMAVGCCSLRVEHIKTHDQLDGKEFVVEFDFLGKDSIR